MVCIGWRCCASLHFEYDITRQIVRQFNEKIYFKFILLTVCRFLKQGFCSCYKLEKCITCELCHMTCSCDRHKIRSHSRSPALLKFSDCKAGNVHSNYSYFKIELSGGLGRGGRGAGRSGKVLRIAEDLPSTGFE